MRDDLLWVAAYAGCVASLIILFILGGGSPLRGAMVLVSREAGPAAVFFTQSTTSAQIQAGYANSQSAKKIRVLIVPGHQPDGGGTEFGARYERDIVVDIADALAALLSQNQHYDVMVARTKTAWNPVLQSYFDRNASAIEAFQQSQARLMNNYIAQGSILPLADQVYHNTAPSVAVRQLYGINKWASENAYDIILHLHLNDYAGRRARWAGTYDGFTIYVPDRQYSNAEASRSVGASIAARLNAYHATSTLPKEDRGIVEDQQLIAIGSNNSVDGAALLIEYGYIYEPQFRESSILSLAVVDYAYQTYLGLQDFFKDPVQSTYGSVSFPYDWTKVAMKEGERGASVYALQAALRYLGYYPPSERSFSDCPISGVAGACTHSAIKAYQRAHDLEATGMLGPKTRAELKHELAAR